MGGVACGMGCVGAVAAPDAVVLVDNTGTTTDGSTAAEIAGFDSASALQALQKTFPASKIVLAQITQSQASPAGPDVDAPSLDATLAALAQAGEKNILVQPAQAANPETLLQVEETVTGWRARKAFRRLSLTQAPAANPAADSAAMPPQPGDIAKQAELTWWGKNPWFRQGR